MRPAPIVGIIRVNNSGLFVFIIFISVRPDNRNDQRYSPITKYVMKIKKIVIKKDFIDCLFEKSILGNLIFISIDVKNIIKIPMKRSMKA